MATRQAPYNTKQAIKKQEVVRISHPHHPDDGKAVEVKGVIGGGREGERQLIIEGEGKGKQRIGESWVESDGVAGESGGGSPGAGLAVSVVSLLGLLKLVRSLEAKAKEEKPDEKQAEGRECKAPSQGSALASVGQGEISTRGSVCGVERNAVETTESVCAGGESGRAGT